MEIFDEVKVNNITSGKLENGVISFTFGRKDPSKGRQVKYVRCAENGIYEYNHHLSDKDLEVLSSRFSSIPDRKAYENKFGKHYLKCWGQDLKQAIARIMLNGEFVIERELDDGRKVFVKFMWDGEIPKEFKV